MTIEALKGSSDLFLERLKGVFNSESFTEDQRWDLLEKIIGVTDKYVRSLRDDSDQPAFTKLPKRTHPQPQR